jgi:hypothetical protein
MKGKLHSLGRACNTVPTEWSHNRTHPLKIGLECGAARPGVAQQMAIPIKFNEIPNANMLSWNSFEIRVSVWFDHSPGD